MTLFVFPFLCPMFDLIVIISFSKMHSSNKAIVSVLSISSASPNPSYSCTARIQTNDCSRAIAANSIQMLMLCLMRHMIFALIITVQLL